jgi:ABC-type dipeptide/oligopeptide/nickel transport system permease component
MAEEPIDRASGSPIVRAGPLLSEALVLLLTLAVSVTLVALLIFSPRAFLSQETFSLSGLLSYLAAVRDYVFGLLRGDLGKNARNIPIGGELLTAAGRSLQLLGVALVVGLPLGLFWGGLLATVRRGWQAALLFGLSTLVISLPTFVVMVLAIRAVATLTLRTGVQLALVQGYGLDRHLILPTAVLALRGAAYMARAIQVAQEEIMRQDWIRAARAKGLGGLALWRRHVLPALRLPLLGSTLGMLRVMVSGLVIVDYLYGWNGLGGKLLRGGTAAGITPSEDRVAAGAAVMLVCFFVFIDALGRLALRRADPRLREGLVE